MEVVCENLGKRFQFNWIIRNCNWTFIPNSITGISGRNGSGKSTLIRMLATQLSPSTGKIHYNERGKRKNDHSIYQSLSLVGPYTSLIQEYTLEEQFNFHFKFKEKLFHFTYTEFLELLDYDGFGNKMIEAYSSGMHQRVQLAFALLSNSSLLLFDEPTSFLDIEAKKWFYSFLDKYQENRNIVIASNDAEDLNVCERIYEIEELKTIS